MDAKKRLILIVSGLALLSFLLSFYAWFDFSQNKNLEVIFFDVGQGDSILIKTPNRQNILIDGGPDLTVLYKLGEYLPFYDRTIDLMILTHPHSDHVAGLVDVLKRYKVKKVLGTGVVHASADYLKWLELIKDKNIDFIKADGYKKIDFSNENNKLILEVLYPFKDISQDGFGDLNESSIVMKLTFYQNSFLFMGDLPRKEEDELIKLAASGLFLKKRENVLKAQVLKIGHHGGKDSSSPKFLEQINPDYAIIQVGKDNRFGHPHRRTIRNLERIGARILRTDKDGDIVFASDGEILTLNDE